MLRAPTSLVLCALVVVAPVHVRADPAARAAPVSDSGPEEVLDQKLAVWRFDALGIDPELVGRLETLFRMELDRLDRQPMPSRRDIDRAITGEARDCTGEDRCLAAIGKKLGVDIIIAGTVGQLGDNYVLTIKAVEVATARSLQRIQSDPLRGQPDELIEGVRVAAYRLLAPDQLHGALQVQTDVVGAQVAVDGKPVGTTPLPRNGLIAKLSLGKHHLRVAAATYDQSYDDDIEIRFQKVSPVVVRLVPSTQVLGTGKIERIERDPFYSRTWFIVVAGVAAVGLGAAIGYRLGHTKVCHPDADGVHPRMLKPLALLAVLTVARPVHADRVVAIAPLSTLGAEDTSPDTRKLTGEIEAAVAALPATKVVRAAQVADAIKRAKKPQLRACEGDAGCLAELASLVGAQIVISGEVGGLGSSRVVYLAANAGGKELRSTTLTVGGTTSDGPAGAATRLLDPDGYRGALHLAIDAPGATIYVNGTKIPPSPSGTLALPVGTQAVRVTHPEYHDFVRFIDVDFGKTTDVAVNLQQYPIARHDLQGKPIARDAIDYIEPPPWRRWYVVGPAAVGLAIITGIAVGYAAHNFPSADCRKLGGGPC